jgi:hypothetical protein
MSMRAKNSPVIASWLRSTANGLFGRSDATVSIF